MNAWPGARACSSRPALTTRCTLSWAPSYPRPRNSSNSRWVDRRSRLGTLASASRIAVRVSYQPPLSLVEDEHGVSARRDVGADLVEMVLHALGVGALHDDGGAGLALRTDGAEQID